MKKYVSFLLCILIFIPAWGYAQQIKNATPSDAGDNNPTTFRFMPDNTDKQLANKENAPLSRAQVNDGSIAIFVDGQDICNNSTPIEIRKKLMAMDLSNTAGWPNIKVTPGYIAVDPEIGRFKFADGDMERSKLTGRYDAIHTAYGVCVQDGYAYVANFQQGLEIIDVSVPEKPVPIGNYNTVGWAYEVYVSGKYAFVADGYSGLQIIDISSPKNPVLLGSCDTPGWAYDVQVVGRYAYVADYRSGLQIIDVSNPLEPFIVGKLELGGAQCRGIYVANNYAYIADDKSGLFIVDVDDAANPTLLSTYRNNNKAKGVFVSNNYAYLVNYQSLLEVIDVSNPKNPIVKARLSLPGNPYDIVGFDKYAYIAAGSGGIHIIDLTEPINPRLIETFKTDGKAFDLHASDGFVFVADDYQGLKIIDTPYPYEPPIGKITVDYYLSDLKASLTSPNGGELWAMGSQQNIIWDISGGIPPYNVNLSYAKDGFYQFNPNIVKGLKQGSPGPNAYIWTLPAVASDKLGIMVTVVDSNGNQATDISDAYFTLRSDASVVEKKAPLLILLKGITGKEYLMGGGRLDVGWIISGGISPYTVDIYYSIDGGKTYSVMDSNLSQDYYPWTLPHVDSQTIRVKAMVTDALGEKATAVSETFKLDSTPPTVVYTDIPNEQTGIESGTIPFVIQFSERMDKNQQDIIGFVPFASYTSVWNDTGNILTITPNISLPDATYTCTLYTLARDVAGNNLAERYKWSFKTAKEDEITFNVASRSNYGLEISGDYKYTSNHGNEVNLGVEILDDTGILLGQYNITPVTIKKGKGTFKTEVFYIGTQAINSASIRLIMSSNGKPFYTKYSRYLMKWACPITVALKTDNRIYYQGDYANISLVATAPNLPLDLRKLTFDNAIGDMVIRDSSNNIVFQWSKQNLINAKTVTLLDNGARVLLQSTWLFDKIGEYVLDGWLNKSNIYPQIQGSRIRFEVQQMRFGIVSGKITDAVTKQPIQNATVTIGKYNGTTNKNGEYYIVDIDPGVYGLIVQAKGYQPYQREQVSIKKGEQRQDMAIISASELQFEVILDKQIFGVNEPIVATAVLRCSGTRTITVSGLSLESESLLFEVETPLFNRVVRYIGPFSSSLPPMVTLKPGEQTALKLDLGQITFGNKLEFVSGYKIISPGKYALRATYNSWGNQPKRWIGRYQADTVLFEIGTPTTNNNQSKPDNVASNTPEAVISQPQEATSIKSGDWEMQVIVNDKQTTSIVNLGMSSTANDGFDPEFDEPLPPAPADKTNLQVYLPHQDWGMIFENFSRDIRGYSQNAVWSFQVRTSSTDTVATLSVAGLPNGYDIIIKDIDNNRSWDLRTADKYNIYGRTLYRFELSVKAYSAGNAIQTKGLSHTFGKGWSLISIPISYSQQVGSIFKGINTYYLYDYNHDRQGYGEATMITNGNAYWLGMLNTATITIEDNPMMSDVSLPLKPGWNMVGCPFNFTPDWSRVMVKKDGVSKGLTDAVAAGWVMNMLYQSIDSSYQMTERMEAWRGYWFASLVSCELIIPATSSANQIMLPSAPLEAVNNENWQVGLSVSVGRYKDTANISPCFGVNLNASLMLDAVDRPEPPEPQGGFVTLYFTHPEEMIFNKFDWDIKPPADSIYWEFEVKTNLSGENVAITWDKEHLPQGYNLLFIDKDTQTSMIMDKEKGYIYTSSMDNNLSIRHFMVRAIRQEAAVAQSGKAGDLSSLKIWPNPATKPPMTFKFVGKARLKILTQSGELVKDVSDITNEYKWQLDNDGNNSVASGLYFYIISDGLGNKRVGTLAVIR